MEKYKYCNIEPTSSPRVGGREGGTRQEGQGGGAEDSVAQGGEATHVKGTCFCIFFFSLLRGYGDAAIEKTESETRVYVYTSMYMYIIIIFFTYNICISLYRFFLFLVLDFFLSLILILSFILSLSHSLFLSLRFILTDGRHEQARRRPSVFASLSLSLSLLIYWSDKRKVPSSPRPPHIS